MSYAIKVARSRYRGDPGLFGFLGGAIKGVAGVAGAVLPGPLGVAAKGVSGLFGGGGGKTTTPALLRPTTPSILPTGGGLRLPSLPGVGTGAPLTAGAIPSTVSSGSVPTTMKGGACEVGYHKNKSGYWSNESKLLPGASWISPGEKCVKRRRMNPLNPRAASRAIRRIESLKKATARFNRVSVRSKCGCK